jgi:hypothetical protein
MLAALAFTAVYLGGAGADDCDDIAFDPAGYVYLACHSSSEGFTGAGKKDMDAYVVKFDPRSSAIVYKTRIGGSSWDAAFRIVLGAGGMAWVSGTSQSADFPLEKPGRFYGERAAINAFVARLNSEGKVEYVGMIGDATSEGLAVAPGGKVYLAGAKAPGEEKHLAFVAEIQENGGMRIMTLGPGTASGVALDGRGALFASGFSGRGAFVAKIDVAAWKQVGFRSIGSADGDRARAVVVDRAGRPHILGTAVSPGFPSKQRLAGKSGVFLAGFDAKLKKLQYATLFGGSSEDIAGFNGESLKLDPRGNLWIAGLTRSTDLPAQGQFAGGDDGFIASFAPGGRQLRFAAYFGGTGLEILEGLAIAPDGAVWAAGMTASRDWASLDYHGGTSDAVVIRLTTLAK